MANQKNINDERSLLEIAIDLLNNKKKKFTDATPTSFEEILNEVATVRNYDEQEKMRIASHLYNDITLSGGFVYCGNGEWDLKISQPISMVDTDSSDYTTDEEAKQIKELLKTKASSTLQYHKSTNPIDSLDYFEEPEDEKEVEVVTEEKEEVIVEKEVVTEEAKVEKIEKVKEAVEPIDADDTEESDESIDEEEEEYNKYMDEYEDLYEDE